MIWQATFAFVVGLAAVTSLSGAVQAQGEPSSPAPAVAEQSTDLSKQVCRRVEMTGSRLKAKRVCMTQAQWDDQRRQDRMLIERSQMQACTPGSNC